VPCLSCDEEDFNTNAKRACSRHTFSIVDVRRAAVVDRVRPVAANTEDQFRQQTRAAGERGEEEKEGGRGEADKWVPAVSVSRKKRKGEGEGGPTREAGWAAWAEKEPVRFFFFFLFLFQTSFSNHFSSQIQFKLFQTFLKNFIDFLETTQATKNHASQQMMHIHLFSLSLLSYL
jgi:hypothetical protein